MTHKLMFEYFTSEYIAIPIVVAVFIWMRCQVPKKLPDLLECNEAVQRGKERFEAILDSSSSLQASTVFEHQVAGHTKEIIRSFNGMLLKPMIKEINFVKEVHFYEAVESLGTHNTQSPVSFLPKYYGVLQSTEADGRSSSFIVLENLSINLKKPCVMDLKIGRQTFEPTVSEEKKQRNISKYIYQHDIGFRITGFKTFSVINDSYESVEKSFGRSLKPDQVKDGLKKFFWNGQRLRKDVVRVVLTKLEPLWQWARRQQSFELYCSSVLVSYDGSSTHDAPTEDHVSVKIIDFAHTLPRPKESQTNDEGYAFGIQNVIKHLELILEDPIDFCDA